MIIVTFAVSAMFFCRDPKVGALAQRAESSVASSSLCRRWLIAIKAGDQFTSSEHCEFERLLNFALRRGNSLIAPLLMVEEQLGRERKELLNTIKHLSLLRLRAFLVWAICALVAAVLEIGPGAGQDRIMAEDASRFLHEIPMGIAFGGAAGFFLILPMLINMLGDVGWFASQPFAADWVRTAILDQPSGALRSDSVYMRQWRKQWQSGVSTRIWRLDRLRDIAEDRFATAAVQRESFMQLMPLIEAISWTAAAACLIGITTLDFIANS